MPPRLAAALATPRTRYSKPLPAGAAWEIWRSNARRQTTPQYGQIVSPKASNVWSFCSARRQSAPPRGWLNKNGRANRERPRGEMALGLFPWLRLTQLLCRANYLLARLRITNVHVYTCE